MNTIFSPLKDWVIFHLQITNVYPVVCANAQNLKILLTYS